MLIPIRVDVPMSRRPWANYALLSMTVVCSVVGFRNMSFFLDWAGITGYPRWISAITSSFLHAGWLHLVGNMLFLWIFGNAINYKFGHLGYLAFYLCGALVSGMAHYGFDGTPAVGASGAINAVMGAFLIFFPRNDVTIVWIIWIAPGVGRISSGWIIVYWVAWDVLYLLLGAQTGVALWAHVGGFVFGLAVAIVLAVSGLVKPTQDEQTLLQVFHAR